MLLYLHGHDLWRHPETAQKMFQDRAMQFGLRHGWDVHVDSTGFETDQYDPEDPLYVISCSETNPHEGSMRLMPLAGRTMIEEHFPETLPETMRSAPDTWECTRFCVSSGAPRHTAHALFAGGGAYMARHGIRQMVALFDTRMRRLCNTLDLVPVIVGAHRYGEEIFFAGSWHIDPARQAELTQVARLSRTQMERAISLVDRPRRVGQFAA